MRILRAGAMILAMAACGPALAQKQGGILKVLHRDSPATMSILEEATVSTVMPMMAVFNNLVIYDQHVPQNSLQSIVPELAAGWAWNSDGTELTFKLRRGVKWHDGQPFTAADVKCTWDLLTNKSKDRLRINYRGSWYANVNDVTANGGDEAVFHLKQRQPALLALLASGYSPVYPCHVSPAQMRQHPIGTGPFKFVEYKPNQSIKLVRNPDYWKPGRPYLDGIEYTIVPDRATAILGFVAGKFDMTFPFEVTIPMLKDVKAEAPQAVCEVGPAAEVADLLINRMKPPFDNPQLRRAMALTLDRLAFIDILGGGEGDIGGAMQPPPEGVWGMPPEIMKTLVGYDPDVQKNRAEAREIMKSLGYGPDKHLAMTLSARNIALYRDPASILLDQLKQIWIDGELDLTETASWMPKLTRKDFSVALSTLSNSVDDPDQNFYQNYSCHSLRNLTSFCDPDFDRLIDAQSMETDQAKRRQVVWELERRLADGVVRPMIYHLRLATCRQPEVKGLTLMVNSIVNGWRMEDVWLDR